MEPNARYEESPSIVVGYVTLSDAKIDRTIQVHEDVLIDVDVFGKVVGIELLRLDWRNVRGIA